MTSRECVRQIRAQLFIPVLHAARFVWALLFFQARYIFACRWQIQRMVITGGNFRPDTLKPKEVVSLLLDDDEMERKRE